MRIVIQATGLAILVLGLLLQTHLRAYPWYHSGCRWPERADLKIVAFGDPQITGFLELQQLRKRVDIVGNDKYLSQVASTIRHHLNPEYVAIVGDLLSSQWIPDDEFDKRADRFAEIFPTHAPGHLVNISGNHDIGYHGEITSERLERFERRFGLLNYIVTETPEYRIVVINSMSLDGPPNEDKPQLDTQEFLKSLSGYRGSSVLLTHIPLYKPESIPICNDGPNFEYYGEQYGHVLQQQNHLSEEASKFILDNVFRGGSGGIIVAGHDHEGCYAEYTLSDSWRDIWRPSRPSTQNSEELKKASGYLGFLGFGNTTSVLVKEFTVRSIMGEFGGNSGLISGSINDKTGNMEFTYSLCRFHVQHVWWVAQVLTLIGLTSIPIILIW